MMRKILTEEVFPFKILSIAEQYFVMVVLDHSSFFKMVAVIPPSTYIMQCKENICSARDNLQFTIERRNRNDKVWSDLEKEQDDARASPTSRSLAYRL